jgi:hypothetical protein
VTTSAAQTSAFFTEATRTRQVFTIRDGGGVPAPESTAGSRAMPFWFLERRARRVIDNVSAYGSFEPVAIPLDELLSRWIPGLAKDGLLVGINWAGDAAIGYELTPDEVLKYLDAHSAKR